MPDGSKKRNRNDLSLLHNGSKNPVCMGCPVCPDFKVCGGLNVKKSLFDCSELCQCSTNEERNSCELACPNNPPKFVARYHEVSGWELKDDQGPFTPIPVFPEMVPLIKDKSCRKQLFYGDTVALRLDQLFSKKTGEFKFKTRHEINERFGLAPSTRILISSVSFDECLERFWDKGRRAGLVEQIASINPELMTVPNFSLFSDVPRQENLYNMKRIVKCWSELAKIQIPCAIHLNARTDRDWERWIDFLNNHPEITAVSFEFTSGAKGSRGQWYQQKLLDMASRVMSSLTLILRGGTRHLEPLSKGFDQIVFVYAKPYVATMNRQRFVWEPGKPLAWKTDITPKGQPLDELFSHNVAVATRMVTDRTQSKVMVVT